MSTTSQEEKWILGSFFCNTNVFSKQHLLLFFIILTVGANDYSTKVSGWIDKIDVVQVFE